MEQRIVFLCGRIREKANELLARELREQGLGDMVPSHGDVLASLYMEDGAKCSEIAARMHRTKATLTVLVDKLEKNGYVERRADPADKRVQRVWLTEKGRDAQVKFDAISASLRDRVQETLSPGELASLDSLLAKLLDGWK